jgi:hypothetical protein
MSETDYNRKPIRMVELRQPRCALRFGVAPCTATTADGPRCYNTRTTCLDTDNYDFTNASITWRFVTQDGFIPDLYSETGQNIATNAIPSLISVSTQPTKLNIAAARDGESPFGVRSTIDVLLQDIPWDDHVGDFYLANRDNPNRGTFWAKWKARNEYTSLMTLALYEGYEGQALSAMQKRLFILERVDGPSLDGSVRLHGVDPLQLADRRRALFPRPTPIILKSAIDAGTTSISVFASNADLADAFGNTGGTRFVRVRDEIIAYTGFALVDPTAGEYTLSGVQRGALDTVASSHGATDTLQRVGRYQGQNFWRVAYDLLTVHARVPSSYIDLNQWDDEGDQYLAIFQATGTVTQPTPVADILGELCQQGMFSIWWDERRQTIPLLAVRPPRETPIPVNDDANIMPGAKLREDPNARFTRVFLYYAQRNPVRPLNDVGNYARGQVNGSPEVELPEVGGEVRTQIIFARWIREDALAIQLASRLLARYEKTPRYLTISLDAKDRFITIGDVVGATTRTITDSEGAVLPVLWQVISENEVRPGDTIVYDLQTYSFVGKFAVYMADGSPNHDAATEEQRAFGGWYAGNDGLMGDGSKGYQYQ